MNILNLNLLKTTLPGITQGQGYFLWEAVLLCLEDSGHQSGVILKVTGKYTKDFKLIWTGKVNPEMKHIWGDIKEATEYAAMAISVLTILELTNYIISGRSRQGTSIDYFLIPSQFAKNIFTEPKATLEVSGILKENKGNTINMRINEKIRRLKDSPFSHLPNFIIVTEFGIPKTKIVQK